MPDHVAIRLDVARRVAPTLLVLSLVSCATPGRVSTAADIDDLARNVASNEALYKNIQFTYKESYIDHRPKRKKESTLPTIRKDESTRRLVYQGDKVFSSENSASTNFNSSGENATSRASAWNGRVAHALNGKILHIIDEAIDTATWPRPHNLLVPYFIRMPLSVMCEGGSSPRRIKGRGDLNLDTEVVGREQLDGDECVKLKVLSHRDGEDPVRNGYVRVFWINTAKNYLPVRMIGYRANSSPDHIEGLAVTESMIGLEDSLWFPERIVYKTYDADGGFKAGTPRLETTIVCSDVELNPKNDPSLFSDIPVGPDVLKYRIKNGKIVETIRPLIHATTPPPDATAPREGPSASTYAGMAGGAGLLAALAMFLRSKLGRN